MTLTEGSAAIVVLNGHVLLIKRNCIPNKGYWALPGGRKEEDETYEEAAIREVKEEVGIDIEIQEQFCERFTVIDHVVFFTSKPTTLKFNLQKEEVSEAEFVDLQDIQHKRIVPTHNDVLLEFRRKKQ